MSGCYILVCMYVLYAAYDMISYVLYVVLCYDTHVRMCVMSVCCVRSLCMGLFMLCVYVVYVCMLCTYVCYDGSACCVCMYSVVCDVCIRLFACVCLYLSMLSRSVYMYVLYAGMVCHLCLYGMCLCMYVKLCLCVCVYV